MIAGTKRLCVRDGSTRNAKIDRDLLKGFASDISLSCLQDSIPITIRGIFVNPRSLLDLTCL